MPTRESFLAYCDRFNLIVMPRGEWSKTWSDDAWDADVHLVAFDREDLAPVAVLRGNGQVWVEVVTRCPRPGAGNDDAVWTQVTDGELDSGERLHVK